MAYAKPGSANDFIERQLDEHVEKLSKITAADVLTFSGAILYGVDDVIRSGVEELQRQKSGRKKLGRHTYHKRRVYRGCAAYCRYLPEALYRR